MNKKDILLLFIFEKINELKFSEDEAVTVCAALYSSISEIARKTPAQFEELSKILIYNYKAHYGK